MLPPPSIDSRANPATRPQCSCQPSTHPLHGHALPLATCQRVVQERLRPLRTIVKLQALLASGVLRRLCRRRRRRRLLLVVGPNSLRAILLLCRTLCLQTLWGQKRRGK